MTPQCSSTIRRSERNWHRRRHPHRLRSKPRVPASPMRRSSRQLSSRVQGHRAKASPSPRRRRRNTRSSRRRARSSTARQQHGRRARTKNRKARQPRRDNRTARKAVSGKAGSAVVGRRPDMWNLRVALASDAMHAHVARPSEILEARTRPPLSGRRARAGHGRAGVQRSSLRGTGSRHSRASTRTLGGHHRCAQSLATTSDRDPGVYR